MMRFTFTILLIGVYFLDGIVCPPVTNKPVATELPETAEADENLGLEYERYLKEVVAVLESDENFRKKLEESNISDIKSGEIAKHLDFVGHGIRTQLDEIKRKEIDRLRQVMRLKSYLQNGLKASYPELVLPEIDKEKILGHLDHNNPNTFEVSDLAQLIKQATKDLESIDRKRKEEFKNYEMEKEVLRREQLKGMDDTHRQEEEKKFEEMQKKHDDPPKLHHPGNEEQLKEVWEESDGLNKRDFDPRTFFHLHDTNGDGYLDSGEVEALFQQELDKVYDPNAPEDDMMERYEEMNRMREHLMTEVDRNKDQLISMEEFIESTRKDEFKQEEGWQPIDGDAVYSEEELKAFQQNYEERMRLEQEQGKPQHEQQRHEQDAGGSKDVPHPVVDQQHVQQQPVVHEQQHVQQPVQEHVQQQQQQIVHQEQPVVHQEQPVVHQEQPAAHQQQPVVHEQQPVQHEQQPVVFEHQPQPAQEHAGQQQQQQQVAMMQPAGHEQVVMFQQPAEGHQQQQQQQQQQPAQQHVEG